MFLKKLKLKNYRNYLEQEIDFSKKNTVILGQNAQGKTNLLEAINLLSQARSPREHKTANFINFESKQAYLKADILSDKEQNIKLDIEFLKNKKIVYINKKKIAKTSELFGFLRTVFLYPTDIAIIESEPAIRRNTIDLFNAQCYFKYSNILKDYKICLKNRNAMLKESRPDLVFLKILEEKMVKLGISIMNYREKSLLKIEKTLKNLLNGIIDKELSIKYINSASFEADSYQAMLAKNFEKDKLFGSTLIGPHRDDFLIAINNLSAKEFCSRGQQRAIVIALKLAFADFMNNFSNPIVLIDDVLLEIDDDNIRKLIEKITLKNQIIITALSIARIPKKILQDAEIFQVKNGIITKKD